MGPCIEQNSFSIRSFVKYIIQIIIYCIKIYQQHQHSTKYKVLQRIKQPLRAIHGNQQSQNRFYGVTRYKSPEQKQHYFNSKTYDNDSFAYNIRWYDDCIQYHNNYDSMYLDVDALQLLDEINNNLQWIITPQNIHHYIGKKQQNKCSLFMKKYNLELSQSEFIAIKLWSLSERLTKQYHLDCSNHKSFKWKLFIHSLTNGITKIYKAVIINALNDDEKELFPSLPQRLYRGTKVFNPNCQTWKLDTILSFTTSLCIAAAFGESSEYNGQNEVCVLNIVDAMQYLFNGQLIAAPIEWLSMYDTEDEWIVLPCSAIFCVMKDNKTPIIVGSVYNLFLTDNVAINHMTEKI